MFENKPENSNCSCTPMLAAASEATTTTTTINRHSSLFAPASLSLGYIVNEINFQLEPHCDPCLIIKILAKGTNINYSPSRASNIINDDCANKASFSYKYNLSLVFHPKVYNASLLARILVPALLPHPLK